MPWAGEAEPRLLGFVFWDFLLIPELSRKVDFVAGPCQTQQKPRVVEVLGSLTVDH